jgi:hypothetical protein
MSLAGDEDYYMNGWAAGAVGQITPKERRLSGEKSLERKIALKGNQICSTHPAHLSSVDNNTLLWFNSGIEFCKHPDAFKQDINRALYGPFFETGEDLSKFYKEYTKVEAIIVPKHMEYFVGNDLGENTRGWDSSAECRGYMFCAYDKVGGRDNPVSNGQLVEFNAIQKNLYNFYGSSGGHCIELLKIDEFMTKNNLRVNGIDLSRSKE